MRDTPTPTPYGDDVAAEDREMTVRGSRYDMGFPEERSASTRDALLAVVYVAGIGAVLTAFISVIPDIDAVWQWPVLISLTAALLLFLGLFLMRSVQRFFFFDPSRDVTSYMYNPERGTLYKGDIRNVALRVDTIHALVDSLVEHVPEERRRDALYEAGRVAGIAWSSQFVKQSPRPGATGANDEIPTLLLRWAHYDATAGMGRLSVAAAPDLTVGTVMLSNSFLSTLPSCFPLNYWFAGYMAATLQQLFGREVAVELLTPRVEQQSTTLFEARVLGELPRRRRRRPIQAR